MMQPALKAEVDKTTAGHRLAAKSTKQAADGSIHHHAKKELCVTVPGGWVGLQNLHDAIVVAFQHEMQNNRNAV
jgi:hypothetical protein